MSAQSVSNLIGLVLVVQVAERKQACAELQQQLQQQTEAHTGAVSDLDRMTSKVQNLQFDFGNVQQSLQVIPSFPESVMKMPMRSHVLLYTHPRFYLLLLQNFQCLKLLHVMLQEEGIVLTKVLRVSMRMC